jgi:glycosyltransferase involved in cell wall biosynthesis
MIMTRLLAVLPSIRSKKVDQDTFFLPKKFVTGILEYQKHWEGEVEVFLEEANSQDNNLDNRLFSAEELPFHVKFVKMDRVGDDLQNAAMVLASADFRQNFVGSYCRENAIPCAYVTEYSLKTRIQAVNAETQNPIIRLRRYLWQVLQERKQRQAIAMAAGLQANGTPTYEAYKGINPMPLLYFDSRITQAIMASHDEIERRQCVLEKTKKLRLAFSGRLIKIKGADHLLIVAKELKNLGIDFEMHVCGGGDLFDAMSKQIAAQDLANCVKMKGVMDFDEELVPFVKENIDLFVCCHRQGDPSCSYIETLGCGVPIIGYDNEALSGILQLSGAGWMTGMNQPLLLAKRIADLSRNHLEIRQKSRAAVNFAQQHTFSETFARRVSHLLKVSENFYARNPSRLLRSHHISQK